MWHLTRRRNNGRVWKDVGDFEHLDLAAVHILESENDQMGTIFFRVYVDPMMEASDAKTLSRLEYQTDTHFYVLMRTVQ